MNRFYEDFCSPGFGRFRISHNYTHFRCWLSADLRDHAGLVPLSGGKPTSRRGRSAIEHKADIDVVSTKQQDITCSQNSRCKPANPRVSRWTRRRARGFSRPHASCTAHNARWRPVLAACPARSQWHRLLTSHAGAWLVSVPGAPQRHTQRRSPAESEPPDNEFA